MRITRYLIVRADGDVRVMNGRKPRLSLNEVAFKVNIDLPAGWGTTRPESIDLTMPPAPLPGEAIPADEEDAGGDEA